MKKIIIFYFIVLLFIGCKSIDLEQINDLSTEKVAENIEEESYLNEVEEKKYLIKEELKVQDIENTIVYVEKPVYIPESKENSGTERSNATGYKASVESLEKAIVKPEQYKLGTFFYQFNENLVYEIYAQPYHLTDIILEAGEVVTSPPLLSEDETAWELTAGVSRDISSGLEVQHLFIKPVYSKLDSSLIIITDRRVYHLRLKSFSDTHMSMVRFSYPGIKNKWIKSINDDNGRTVESDYIRISNPELLSFDYKMSYSIFKVPEFLPTRVYDDGQITYIQVDDIVLQKKLPLIFNEKDEIVNYSVKKNVFVIPRLINKVTLRLGKEKVTIEKKKSKVKIDE